MRMASLSIDSFNQSCEIICGIFKIEKLLQYQKEAFQSILKGKDCFICQPTGSGKSLIFQALPFFVYAYEKLLEESDKSKISSKYVIENCNYCVIIISPLNSLMKDQLKYLERIGVESCMLSHDPDLKSSHEDLVNVKKVVFCSPENILGDYRYLFKDSTFNKRIFAIVVDESHCIKKWGNSSKGTNAFRKSYSELSELRSLVFQKVPMLSLTATATKETKKLILDSLCMNHPAMISSTPERKNIKFSVVKIENRRADYYFQYLIEDLKNNTYKADKVLIFCRLYDDVRTIFAIFDDALGERFDDFFIRPYAMYHAKTEEIIKEHVVSQFSAADGTVRVLIATIAFGMGVNCKNLNTIIHFGPPGGLDDYFQEAGRGGRDGSDCDAVLVNYPKCCNSSKISKSVKDYVKNTTECRRVMLLKEFDELYVSSDVKPAHKCCDICERSCACQGETCVEKIYVWWRELCSRPKKMKIRQHLPVSSKVLLEQKLKELQLQQQIRSGHAGSKILSGFPNECINQIVSIAHVNIQSDDIFSETALLNKDLIPNIISLIKEVCSEQDSVENCLQECDIEIDSNSDSDSDSDSDNDSDSSDSASSCDYHVSLKTPELSEDDC